MEQVKMILDKSGTILIPDKYQKMAGIYPGDEVLIILEADGIRITHSKDIIRQAQNMVRRYIPAGRMLSEELIQERRKESGNE